MLRFALLALGVAAAIAIAAALADLAGLPPSGGAHRGRYRRGNRRYDDRRSGGQDMPALRRRTAAVSDADFVETGAVGRLDMPELRLRD